MLDEKGTAAALRAAYKGGGYRVAFAEGKVMIRTDTWGAEIEEEYIIPKILGAIVEHIGVVPKAPAAYFAQKKADPGMTCMLDTELNAWVKIHALANAATTPIRRTRLMMDGYEIWQTKQGLRARPMDPSYTRIIDEGGVNQAFVRMDGEELSNEIYYKGFTETAVIYGVKYKKDGGLERIEGFPWLGKGS